MISRSCLRVGDLVQLTGSDWAVAWREVICIVTANYPSARILGQNHRRWQVLAATGDMLVVTREDVTIIQCMPK